MKILLSSLIPDFVPVPSSEVMNAISIGSLIVGAILVIVGIILYLLIKKKGKSLIPAWIFLGVGGILILNHAVQLLT